MVKGGGLPPLGGMAGLAFSPQFALVAVILAVAGGAVRRGAGEYVILMAARTGRRCMLAGQLERAEVMVVSGGLPSFRRMAGLAFRPQFALVRIGLRVTGGAAGWGILQVGLGMAVLAAYLLVLSLQFEVRLDENGRM